MPSKPIRVLFVCLGNICRSPMAEAVFAHKVRELGLEGRIEADSAGTGSWHIGDQPHHGTMRVLKAKQIEYSHAARQITRADLSAWDYIVTMDSENYRDVHALGSSTAKLVAFTDFAPDSGYAEVPDPWFTGNFTEVYNLVEIGSHRLLDTIVQEHGL